jgi:hypothetical protein
VNSLACHIQFKKKQKITVVTLALFHIVQVNNVLVTVLAVEIGSFDLLVRAGYEEATRAWFNTNHGAWVDGQVGAYAVLVAHLHGYDEQFKLRITNTKKIFFIKLF